MEIASDPCPGPIPVHARSSVPAMGPIPDAGPRGPQPVHVGLALQLDPARRAMRGIADIVLRNTTPAPLDHLYLRLWANAAQLAKDGGSAAIHDVVAGGQTVQPRTDRTVVDVPLPAPLLPGASTTLHYGFDVTVPNRPNRMGASPDGHEVWYGNAIPLLEVHDAGGWELHPYFDLGESFLTLQTDIDATITAPTGCAAVTSGHVTADTPDPGGLTHTITVQAPHVRDFAVMAANDWATATGTIGATTIRAYADHANAKRAQSMLATSIDAMAHYGERYGAYPYPDVSVVSAPHIGGGMEYPNLALVDLDSIEGRADQPSTIAHELAHQWFYGMVGNDQFREPWLDESMATFAAHDLTGHYPGIVGGPPPARSQLIGLSAGHDISAPVSDIGGSEVGYLWNAYFRGDHALRELRSTLGEQVFFAGLRGYLDSHRDGVATTTDLIAAMSAAAGRDLTDWFADHHIRANEPDAARTLDPNGLPAG